MYLTGVFSYYFSCFDAPNILLNSFWHRVLKMAGNKLAQLCLSFVGVVIGPFAIITCYLMLLHGLNIENGLLSCFVLVS